MKRDYLRSALALMVGVLMSFTSLDAQTFDLGLSTGTTSCQYCATVQIKSAGSPFNLGGLSFVFSYNEDALTYQSYTSLNFDENTMCNGQGNLFSAQTPFVSDGEVSSGVAPTIFTGFDSCPEVGSEWVDVAEICFDITDESQSGQLNWSSDMSQFPATTSQDLLTNLSIGTLTNVDETVVCAGGGGGGAGGGAVDGCTDPTACNYDATATSDDGSCAAIGSPCDDNDATTTNDIYQDDCSCAGTPDGGGGGGGGDCDIVVTEIAFDCDETAGEFTYTIMIAGGAPGADPTATYDLTGTGIANPLMVFAKTMVTLGPYTDGAAVEIDVTDENGCAATFTSGGVVACVKEECENPIVIAEEYMCDEEEGEFSYTFTPSGGAPSDDPTEFYTVNGTGVVDAQIAAGASLTLIYSDGTAVSLTFTDSDGCETEWDSGGVVACSKDDCDDPVVITELYECDEEAGIFTYTFVLTGGAPSADPTEFYTVTGTNIGAPLMAFAGSPVVLSYADGTAVNLTVVDSNDCEAIFDTGDPIACSKEDDDECETPTPASLQFAGGGDSVDICLGAGEMYDIDVVTAPGGEDGFFLITDGSGSTILAGPVTPPLNFDTAPPGTCQIWHLTYNGDFSVPASMLVADVEGCFSLSNPLNVVRADPPSAPQIFEVSLGGTSVGVCNNMGFVNEASIGITTPGTGAVTEYVLTDTAGNIILGPQANATFNFLGYAGGNYNLWAITYTGDISHTGTAASITGCFALSNAVTVQVTPDCEDDTVECVSVNAAFVTLAGLVCENTMLNGSATISSSNPNDVVTYVLADQNGNNLISNSNGVFAPNMIPGFAAGAFYYITVQAGPDMDGDGFPDVNDQCFTAVQGPVLTWATCVETFPCIGINAAFVTLAGLECENSLLNAAATITSSNPSDAVIYVLADQAGNNLISNTDGLFAPNMIPGFQQDAFYYVTVQGGPDTNGDGFPDVNDQCFTAVQGPVLVWGGCEDACPTVAAGGGLVAVCAGGSANVAGTVSGQGGYAVAYVLHTSPAYSPSSVVATSFNGVFANPGGSNVPYYSSILVGTDLNNDGVPDANSTCYAVYSAQQVVFLAPLSIVVESETCEEDTGITTVSWVITGGLPQFNPSAFYNVTGSVNQSVGYNQIFSTTFSDGETSSLNVFDSFCGGTQAISGGPYTCKDLPIELLVFDGEVQGKGNYLYWVTAVEIDNDFFTLERSFDGFNFEAITVIEGAGNSIVNLSYDYLDEGARPGANYYRLRQTDFNNTTTVTDAIELYREFDDNVTTISPVPANDFITVSYEAANDVEVIMSVYDIIGRQVMMLEMDMVEGINNTDLGLENLASGVYLLSIEAGNQVTTKKFIKN